MASPTRTGEPTATPRALVAVPYRRHPIVSAAAVFLAAAYGLTRAAAWRRPGGIDPPVLDWAWITLAPAVLPLCAVVARYRRRAPEFGVFQEGIKLPFRRIPPGRSMFDPAARGFFSWDEVTGCRWSPHRPGVLSVQVPAVVHQRPGFLGRGAPPYCRESLPPSIHFYRVPEPHHAEVEAAIRECGKWAAGTRTM
jgi:hypothetical protein